MSDAPITVVLAITESDEHPDFYKLQLSGMGGPFCDAARTLLADGNGCSAVLKRLDRALLSN